ncbi:transglycosylase family protein, partial [Actinacidiphila rubida]|uniref:transglycosylase family protein n=1 Tax=Actinacidiphila rubida TaxID=310780 RepID=UPI00114C8C07
MSNPARRLFAPALAIVPAATLTVALCSASPAHAASVATWEKVAQCESSGNWSINTGNGFYGGLQFTLSTWNSYGGQQYAAYPNQATEQQQILIGEKVLAGQGEGAWPVCGPAAGLGSDPADPYPSAPDPTPPVAS